MSGAALSPMQRVGIAGACVRHAVGWSGCLGIALLVGAAVLMFRTSLHAADSSPQATLAVAAGSPSPAGDREREANLVIEPESVPHASESDAIIARIKNAAESEGLAWARADYRLTDSTADSFAALEVKTSLKAPYPRVRRYLAHLFNDLPTLTLREFVVSRPTSEAPDVEVKLGILVFVRDERQLTTPTSRAAP